MGRSARNARGSRNRRPTTGAAPKSLNQGSLNPRVSPQEQNVTSSYAKPSQLSAEQTALAKSFEAAMKKAAQERISDPNVRRAYNERMKKFNNRNNKNLKGAQAQGRVPVKQVKQPVVRPTVDPMRQPTTGPQYSKGGSVSRTGHTDYRKKGMFK